MSFTGLVEKRSSASISCSVRSDLLIGILPSPSDDMGNPRPVALPDMNTPPSGWNSTPSTGTKSSAISLKSRVFASTVIVSLRR